jgi:hypothetical protein
VRSCLKKRKEKKKHTTETKNTQQIKSGNAKDGKGGDQVHSWIVGLCVAHTAE